MEVPLRGPCGSQASGCCVPLALELWKLSQAAEKFIFLQVSSWIHLLGKSLTAPTAKWTESGCKVLHNWKGEGQQFHSELSSEHSWVEEGKQSRILEKTLG